MTRILITRSPNGMYYENEYRTLYSFSRSHRLILLIDYHDSLSVRFPCFSHWFMYLSWFILINPFYSLPILSLINIPFLYTLNPALLPHFLHSPSLLIHSVILTLSPWCNKKSNVACRVKSDIFIFNTHRNVRHLHRRQQTVVRGRLPAWPEPCGLWCGYQHRLVGPAWTIF